MNLKTLFKPQGMHMSGLYKGKFMYWYCPVLTRLNVPTPIFTPVSK